MEPAYWVAGWFGGAETRLYGHENRDCLDMWKESVKFFGMSGLKGFTKIQGPWTEAKACAWVKKHGGEVAHVGRIQLPGEKDPVPTEAAKEAV